MNDLWKALAICAVWAAVAVGLFHGVPGIDSKTVAGYGVGATAIICFFF